MRKIPLGVAVLLTTVLMSGCTPGAAPAPGDTDSTPLPSASAGDGSCRGLALDEPMYQLNPNFALLPDFEPDEGTATAEAVGYDGIACRWQNLSNGVTIDIGVATLDGPTLERVHEAATQTSQIAVDQTADETYFIVGDDSVAHEQVFHGSHWITIDSIAIASAADAAGLVEAITASVG